MMNLVLYFDEHLGRTVFGASTFMVATNNYDAKHAQKPRVESGWANLGAFYLGLAVSEGLNILLSTPKNASLNVDVLEPDEYVGLKFSYNF